MEWALSFTVCVQELAWIGKLAGKCLTYWAISLASISPLGHISDKDNNTLSKLTKNTYFGEKGELQACYLIT